MESQNAFRAFIQNIVHLTNEQWEYAIGYFKLKKLKKGNLLVQSGQICQEVAFLAVGTIRIFYVNHKGEEITSCFCTAPSFITSYRSFITQKPSTLTLVATEDCHLFVIKNTDIQNLYQKVPQWQVVGRVSAEKEYIAMENYAAILNNETAKEKYIRLQKEQPEVISKASLEQIASYLGVTRRQLTRIRKELSEKSK
jgi:CRP-like cAMP-binding protein